MICAIIKMIDVVDCYLNFFFHFWFICLSTLDEVKLGNLVICQLDQQALIEYDLFDQNSTKNNPI